MTPLRPNKGNAPATGKVKSVAPKPSRAELLMSATQALATEQLPETHTMTAIEQEPARTSSVAPPLGSTSAGETQSEFESLPGHVTGTSGPGGAVRPAPPLEATTGIGSGEQVAEVPSPAGQTVQVREVSVDSIRPSPFQPKGRPSAAAVASVSEAIERAGSLEALVGPDGAQQFSQLTAESARLAELAYDIAEHGLKVPVEVRTLDDGSLECLSGHRRLAAAKLAERETVPAIDRGEMSNAAAAATVLRGNLHRENFTTWQEATLVTEVQARRRADGYRDNVRTLGAVMGWSHGKVNMLLRIRRSLSPELLSRAGGGEAAAGSVEELLARAAYRDLERLASEPDDDRRLNSLRRLLGLGDAPAGSVRERPVCVHRPMRGGGFVIEVREPVEALAAGDATMLRAHLETQLTRVKARLAGLGHG